MKFSNFRSFSHAPCTGNYTWKFLRQWVEEPGEGNQHSSNRRNWFSVTTFLWVAAVGKLIAFRVEALQLVGSGLSSLLLLRSCLVSAAGPSLGYNIQKLQFPWNSSSLTTWAPPAASGHTLLGRQISSFNLGSQVEITDNHQEQQALAWACSEKPFAEEGTAASPVPWLYISCQVISKFHIVKYEYQPLSWRLRLA